MPVCQQTQTFCANTTWDEYAGQLFWVPIGCQVVLAILMPCIAFGFGKAAGAKGSEFYLASMRRTIFFFSFFEGVFSLICAAIWINRTYSHRVTSESKAVEMVLSIFFIINYFFNAARDGWPLHYVWGPAPMIDVLTVSAVFAMPDPAQTSWIGWGHLRVFRALVAYEYAERFLGIEHLPALTRATFKSLLRVAAVVSALGGTVMLLEILGDPKFVHDSEEFISTDMGALSFLQIVYYIFTTMSTVGFGDFSPTTVLSRLFIIFTIVYGIILFTEELDTIQYLRYIEASGRGRYLPPARGIKQVVVVGGGVKNSSAVLIAFLKELYETGHWCHGWPACCFMSMQEKPDFLKNFIAEMPPHARMRAMYFVGNIFDAASHERLRIGSSQLIVVIPDMAAPDVEQEDENNILRALAVMRAYPRKPCILATISTSGLAKARRVGIKTSRCFSLNRWKSYMFAQSCICRGWITLITNLLSSEEICKDGAPKEVWLTEYKQGQQMEIYAFCVSDDYIGQTFSSLVKNCLEHPSSIMPFAVVMHGNIILNPLHYTFVGRDIVFVLASSHESGSYFDDFANVGEDWEKLFQDSRRFEHIPVENLPGLQNTHWQINLDRRVQDTAQDKKKVDSAAAKGEDQSQIHENNAAKIAEQGKHYLLILLGSNSAVWHQVQLFISLLRSPTLPCKVPILILAPKPGPDADCVDEVFSDDATCSFMLGVASSIDDLHKAGITKARSIVVVATTAGSKDGRLVDSTGVITLNAIEVILHESQRQIPIVSEFLNPESVKLLTSGFQWHRQKKASRRQGTKDLVELSSPIGGIDGLMNSMPSFAHIKDRLRGTGDSDEDDGEFFRGPFQEHPRFASGGVFIMSALGAILAQRCYTPGIIEIMRALICGEDQHSFPWQIAVPAQFVGKTYKEVAIGFTQPPWNACCLGLYRQMLRQDGSQVQYMFTNPHSQTLVKGDDLVIALGSVEFGKLCSDNWLPAFRNTRTREFDAGVDSSIRVVEDQPLLR